TRSTPSGTGAPTRTAPRSATTSPPAPGRTAGSPGPTRPRRPRPRIRRRTRPGTATGGRDPAGPRNECGAARVVTPMRAMTYTEYGDPSTLQLTDAPRPKLGPSAVLIRVERASVNPVDWKVMAGGLDALIDTVFPVIPGWDVAGVIEEVGPDAPEFAP